MRTNNWALARQLLPDENSQMRATQMLVERTAGTLLLPIRYRPNRCLDEVDDLDG